MKHLLTTVLVLFIALAAQAQNPRPQVDTVIIGDGFRYEGQWPEGEGVWCSNNSGLIIVPSKTVFQRADVSIGDRTENDIGVTSKMEGVTVTVLYSVEKTLS